MTAFRFFSACRFAGLALGVALLAASCAPNQDVPKPTASLDLSRYVAVGDSYTAGFSAGGLTRNGQEYSFPNLLAQQFRRVAPDAGFTQPLLEPGTGTGYLELVDVGRNGMPTTRRVRGAAVLEAGRLIDPMACGGPDTLRRLVRSATAAALPQNLGVPGLRLTQIELANLGNENTATSAANFNPYFSRLLPPADSRTYLQAVMAAAAGATFFTYLHGLDDFMPYVRSGGCGTLPTTAQLNQNAKKLLDVLTANGRPGVVAALPPLNALPLLRLGSGIELQTRLQAAAGDNALLYVEDQFGGPAVPITAEDYVLATAIGRVGRPTLAPGTNLLLPYGRDVRHPLVNADVLLRAEYSIANQRLNSHNTELRRLARDIYRLPIMDPSTNASALNLNVDLFDQIAKQISLNGVLYSLDPVVGNVFSLDYYSLTPRGNALLANTFIRAINLGYRTNLATVDVNSLPTTSR